MKRILSTTLIVVVAILWPRAIAIALEEYPDDDDAEAL